MNRFLRILALGLLGATWLTPARAAPVYVDAAWLEPRLGDPSIVLVDMATDPTQYQRFHLPGAVYLPYDALVRRERTGVVLRVDDARLFQVLGFLGITADTHVVVYDDMGGLNASRLFWELERVGHAKVSVLEGGLVDWILGGRKVEATPVQPKPVTYVPQGEGRANEVDLVAVKAASGDGSAAILDVRTPEEYNCDPRNKRSGHIPGAKHWPWDRSVAFDKGFTRTPVPELTASLEALGVADKNRPVITYCRSGHRASQSYLTLRALGYEDVRLYDGSMLDYERDREAQFECQPRT